MGTELIAAWIYKNGELVKQRMQDFFLATAIIIALLLTFTIAWSWVSSGVPFIKKAVSWKILLIFFTITTTLYYVFKLFSGGIFLLYKKMLQPEDEEILFTSNKITSTKKTWILNSDSRNLVSVKFNSAKKKELIFKGQITEPGRKPLAYTVYIPVPLGELRNAEKVYQYFNVTGY